MTCIQNINFVLLLAAKIYIESPPLSTKICPNTLSICGLNIVENGWVASGNWISCKLKSNAGGKTWQPEMGSPKRNFKISGTTGPILRKFADHIGPGMVFWKIEHRDCCLKSHGDRQQTKFTLSIFLEIRISNNFKDKISKKSSK